jgi:hypothetical protein
MNETRRKLDALFDMKLGLVCVALLVSTIVWLIIVGVIDGQITWHDGTGEVLLPGLPMA